MESGIIIPDKIGVELVPSTDLHFLVTGAVSGELRNEHGDIIQNDVSHNLVLTNGLAHIGQRVISADTTGVGDIIDRMAIGDDDTAAAAGQTDLIGSELAAQAMDGSYPSRSAAVVTFKVTYAAGTGTGTVKEAALFNYAMSGTVNVDYFMLARAVVGPYTKGAGDSLALTWTWTFSAS